VEPGSRCSQYYTKCLNKYVCAGFAFPANYSFIRTYNNISTTKPADNNILPYRRTTTTHVTYQITIYHVMHTRGYIIVVGWELSRRSRNKFCASRRLYPIRYTYRYAVGYITSCVIHVITSDMEATMSKTNYYYVATPPITWRRNI